MIRRYYSGVQRGDEIINVRDSVLLKSGTRKKDPPFVARVSGLWEEEEGEFIPPFFSVTQSVQLTFINLHHFDGEGFGASFIINKSSLRDLKLIRLVLQDRLRSHCSQFEFDNATELGAILNFGRR